jgi:hypothetical protein
VYPQENNMVMPFKLEEEKNATSEATISVEASSKPTVEEPSSTVKIKRKKKKINPNILYYPPHIIYAAVGNEIIPDKRIPAPVREEAITEVVPFND